jgi:hypothetical protein
MRTSHARQAGALLINNQVPFDLLLAPGVDVAGDLREEDELGLVLCH